MPRALLTVSSTSWRKRTRHDCWDCRAPNCSHSKAGATNPGTCRRIGHRFSQPKSTRLSSYGDVVKRSETCECLHLRVAVSRGWESVWLTVLAELNNLRMKNRSGLQTALHRAFPRKPIIPGRVTVCLLRHLPS